MATSCSKRIVLTVIGTLVSFCPFWGCGSDSMIRSPRDLLPSSIDNDSNPDSYEIVARQAEEPKTWTFELRERQSITNAPSLRFRWDFGDGQAAEGTRQTHTYAEPGSYHIVVRGIDARGSVVLMLTLTIEIPPPNGAPIVVVGDSQSAFENETVFLNASGTTDPEGDELTFQWSQVSGPLAFLEDATLAIARFVAPAVVDPERLVFSLQVSDGTHTVNALATVDVVALIDPSGTEASPCAFSVVLHDGAGNTDTTPPFDGLRPLTVTATGLIIGAEPSEAGTYTWTIDGADASEATGDTNTVISRVFSSAGLHTIALSLTVAGTTIGCQSMQTGELLEDLTVWPIIAGQVEDVDGNGVAGVTVSANAGGTTTVTNSMGAFTVHVPMHWTGSVVAQRADYEFTPSQQTYGNVAADQLGQRFLAELPGTPTPTGCIEDATCDDGLFCNGAERCLDGICTASTSPCAAGQNCDEQSNSCTAQQFEGYGATTQGGAGGQMYHVTSLADSGPGTLRDGVSNRNHAVQGPRTIVFDVTGTITLQSDLKVNQPYLTIDGSTAPAPGITIRPGRVTSTGYDGDFIVGGTHDIIVRHLRFWGLWQAGGIETNNAATILIDGDTGPDYVARNIVLDHITSRNATDGGPDIWGEVSDVTVQWCLFFYSRHPTTVSHYPPPYQTRQRISMHHNVYAKNGERQPQLRADVRNFDFVNNVIYSWGYFGGGGYAIRIRNESSEPKVSANLINNAFVPTSLADWALVYGDAPGPDADDGGPAGTPAQGTVVTTSRMGSLFVSGNVLPAQNRDHYSTVGQALAIPTYARVTAYPASDLDLWVVPKVGTLHRASEEQLLLNEIISAMGNSTPSCSSNATCSDGLYCNGSEVCTAGQCVAGANPCPTGFTCDEANDRCSAPVPQCATNAACDDGLYCNGAERCISGACVAGTSPCVAGQRCLETSDSCETIVAGTWTPPIGIPEPPFGIHETVENVYGNANYYTHYVDNSRACNDSNNSGRGSATAPRCTIPSSLPAGSVAEVHGGPYVVPDPATFTANGTLSAPVFLRGVNDGRGFPDVVNVSTVKTLSGSYFIIENVKFDRLRTTSTSHHISIRRSEVYGSPNRNCVEVTGEDIVVYDNYIHHAGGGIPLSDDHGITAVPGAQRIWIVDNEIAYNTGDGIQFCHFCAEETAPRFVFIARNKIHDNTENAVDFKTSRDVVVSQNVMYGHRSLEGSDGTAFLIGSNGAGDAAVNIWAIFNHIYNSHQGIRIEAASNLNESPGPAYLIGNRIHNIDLAAFAFDKQGTIYIVGNTVYEADTALNAYWREFFTLHVFNNIFANLRGNQYGNHINVEPSDIGQSSIMSNNLFYQNGNPLIIQWGGATFTYRTAEELRSFSRGVNNRLGDPLFVDTNGADNISGTTDDDFRLRAGSPAIDSGSYGLFDYATTFCTTFSQFIPDCVSTLKVDFREVTRPQGPAWDIGAAEYDPGQ